jgi:hypothetical protein
LTALNLRAAEAAERPNSSNRPKNAITIDRPALVGRTFNAFKNPA